MLSFLDKGSDKPGNRGGSRGFDWQGVTVFLLVIVIIASRVVFQNRLLGNEMDVLPYARQFAEHSWLPGDWYLNLDIGYRYLFNALFGRLYASLGVELTLTFGRLLIAAVFSASIVALFKSLRVNLWLAVPVVFIFLIKQDIVAGEWIIEGVETKSFAYACVIGALAALVANRYRMMFLLLGAALSFHVLVGGYALVCMAGCWLMEPFRHQLRRIFSASWIFPLSAVMGLSAIYRYIFGGVPLEGGIESEMANVYVTFRLPHHLLPASWGKGYYLTLFFWMILLVAMRLLPSPRYRIVAQFALCSAGLFLFGIGLAEAGQTGLLKFYWFRFADVMVPLLGLVGLALLLTDALANAGQALGKTALARKIVLSAPIVAAVVFISVSFIPFVITEPLQVLETTVNPRKLAIANLDRNPVYSWIRENTPPDAVFLIDPAEERFYVEAERATFVTFKHIPQSETDIVEWVRRLKAINRGELPDSSGFEAANDLSGAFHSLEPDQVLRIAERWGVQYMVTTRKALPFERLYHYNGLTVYRLNV